MWNDLMNYMEINLNYREVSFEISSKDGRIIAKDNYASNNLVLKAIYITSVIVEMKPNKLVIRSDSSEIFKDSLKERLNVKGIKLHSDGKCEYQH